MITVSMDLPFNLDSPPAEPPTDCVDPLTWHVALALLDEHRRHGTGQCPACADGAQCDDRILAHQGLLTACGIDNPMALYWQGLTFIRRRNALEELR